jgi:hypothetical protein
MQLHCIRAVHLNYVSELFTTKWSPANKILLEATLLKIGDIFTQGQGHYAHSVKCSMYSAQVVLFAIVMRLSWLFILFWKWTICNGMLFITGT